jgi:hypothetical protein
MSVATLDRVRASVRRFEAWLDRYGETSRDHQSFYAGPIGRRAKALYYRRPSWGILAVGPMVFCEAFVPSARRLFWKDQRFPIADAHYAMGFAMRAQIEAGPGHYEKAVHFLDMLERTRCPGYEDYCWGYPFSWETRTGRMEAGTPLVTSVPYMYEAFSEVFRIDKDERWRRVMRSIAEHALTAYRDLARGPGIASCTYTPMPNDQGGVVNASAYRAFLLTRAALDFSDDRYDAAAARNLGFVLASQNADGSWHYSTDGERDFVDHFHTCFVLKALAKIEQLTGDARCGEAIERGVRYYVERLFDERRLPVPFSRAPRLTVYRRELYDYAECINLGVLLKGRFPALDVCREATVGDVLSRWQKADGSFRSRELLVGWDAVPMHRWAQSQMFRSLCLLLRDAGQTPTGSRSMGVSATGRGD